MTFTFRVVSDEVDDFMREIKIDADATFLDLRNAILDAVKFDKAEIDSFYLCNNDWEKEREIMLEDMDSSGEDDVYLMEETALSDYLEDEGERLIFTFDYLTDRSFFIELKETKPGEHIDAPVVSKSRGEAPSQTVDLDAFEASIDAKQVAKNDGLDLDFENYGSTEYNDDEIDIDSLNIDDMDFR